jgi:phenylpropionate dioxygenase-like ring-hydroxylating dioxygenase large terminal subunit
MGKKIALPPYPNGWYCVGLSKDLVSGQVKSVQFIGEELVLFRTASGKVHAMDAYCPHLGGHFGHGGTVEGETIRCPFHGFCFDG